MFSLLLELACDGKRQNDELRFSDNVWIDGVSLRSVEWFIYYGPRIDLNIASIDQRLKQQHGKLYRIKRNMKLCTKWYSAGHMQRCSRIPADHIST